MESLRQYAGRDRDTVEHIPDIVQNAGRNLGHTRQAGRFQQASLRDFQLLLGLFAGRNLRAQFLITLLQFQRPLSNSILQFLLRLAELCIDAFALRNLFGQRLGSLGYFAFDVFIHGFQLRLAVRHADHLGHSLTDGDH